LHHVVVERWSRRTSWLHARDARAKLLFALCLILAIATTPAVRYVTAAGYAALLVMTTASARLPVHSIAGRAAFVLPFSAAFALANWIAGDIERSVGLVWKSYLSAFAVLLMVSTTPLVQILRALEWFRVPGLVILIAQFLYRYLFVISEQAQHMRLAARSRAGEGRRTTFRGAAAALSVLFVRSYDRADGIQRAMIARGFSGHFPVMSVPVFKWSDTLFAIAASSVCALIRFA
jgi:cobalt/nickel transport system permease protein